MQNAMITLRVWSRCPASSGIFANVSVMPIYVVVAPFLVKFPGVDVIISRFSVYSPRFPFTPPIYVLTLSFAFYNNDYQ